MRFFFGNFHSRFSNINSGHATFMVWPKIFECSFGFLCLGSLVPFFRSKSFKKITRSCCSIDHNRHKRGKAYSMGLMGLL